MSSNERSAARSVILKLRRYRDRIDDITGVDGGGVAAGAPAGAAAQRRLASLKNDLDHDSHECEIGRKRAVQSECEQMFLGPALREAAGAMLGQSGRRLLDAQAKEELRAARAHILNYLEQLEGLYPTL
jgi:acetyl-CoA acetyltransferase